jgi:hypothetical protein
MRALTFILLLFLLSSCSNDFVIDSRLKPHVDLFYSLSDTNLQSDNLIVIQKKNLLKETGSLGRTIQDRGFLYLWDGQITVLIDAEYCQTEDQLLVETVVFHELGHALLSRDHTDNVPSIMHSSGKYLGYRRQFNKPDTYSDALKDDLRHELFNRK